MGGLLVISRVALIVSLLSVAWAPACVVPDAKELTFCTSLGGAGDNTPGYEVFVPDGESVVSLDQKASIAYFGAAPNYDPCCQEVLRDWMCAHYLSACKEDKATRAKPCKPYVCDAEIRVNVEVINSCFDCHDPLFEPLSDPVNGEPECTCPNGKGIVKQPETGKILDCGPSNRKDLTHGCLYNVEEDNESGAVVGVSTAVVATVAAVTLLFVVA